MRVGIGYLSASKLSSRFRAVNASLQVAEVDESSLPLDTPLEEFTHGNYTFRHSLLLLHLLLLPIHLLPYL